MITFQANKLYKFCKQRVSEKKEKMTRLEKATNPLLDVNSLIAFSYILDKLFDENIMTV